MVKHLAGFIYILSSSKIFYFTQLAKLPTGINITYT